MSAGIPGLGKPYPYWGSTYGSTQNGELVPTGTIIQYPVSTPPAGYFNCDGSAISRNNYADLFAILGTTYGSGNGGAVSVTSWGISGTVLTLNWTSPATNLYLSSGDSCSFNTGSVIYNGLVTFASPTTVLVNIASGSGSGSGGTVTKTNNVTFNLPNAQARTIRGYNGSNYAIGGTGGADSYALTPSNIASHAHGTFQGGGTSLASGSGNTSGYPNVGGPNTTAVIYDASGNTITNSGSNGAAFSLVNSYLVLNYCIKY